MNLFAGQQWRCTYKQTCGHSEGRRGGNKLRQYHGNIYITICKIGSGGNFMYDSRSSDQYSETI